MWTVNDALRHRRSIGSNNHSFRTFEVGINMVVSSYLISQGACSGVWYPQIGRSVKPISTGGSRGGGADYVFQMIPAPRDF